MLCSSHLLGSSSGELLFEQVNDRSKIYLAIWPVFRPKGGMIPAGAGISLKMVLIATYTRENAIQDGVLIDVSETAREAGFKYSVAVTRAVWEEIITPDEVGYKQGQSVSGRLWDVLWMCYLAARRGGSGSEIGFSLYVTRGSQEKLVNLKSICHPGDNFEPVITIMMPNED